MISLGEVVGNTGVVVVVVMMIWCVCMCVFREESSDLRERCSWRLLTPDH